MAAINAALAFLPGGSAAAGALGAALLLAELALITARMGINVGSVKALVWKKLTPAAVAARDVSAGPAPGRRIEPGLPLVLTGLFHVIWALISVAGAANAGHVLLPPLLGRPLGASELAAVNEATEALTLAHLTARPTVVLLWVLSLSVVAHERRALETRLKAVEAQLRAQHTIAAARAGFIRFLFHGEPRWGTAEQRCRMLLWPTVPHLAHRSTLSACPAPHTRPGLQRSACR